MTVRITKEQLEGLRAACREAAQKVRRLIRAWELTEEEMQEFAPFVVFCPQCDEVTLVTNAQYWQGHPADHPYGTGFIWTDEESAESCVKEILDEIAQKADELVVEEGENDE